MHKAKKRRERSPSPKEDEEKEEEMPTFYKEIPGAVVCVLAPRGHLKQFFSIPQTVLSQCPLFFIAPNTKPHSLAPTDEDVECLGVGKASVPKEGISFQVAAPSRACIVFGHLQCRVIKAPDATEDDLYAEVAIDKLAGHIAARPVEDPLQIYRLRDEKSLHVCSYTSSSHNQTSIGILDPGDPKATSFTLKSVLRTKYRVEVKTSTLDLVAKSAALCDETKWVRLDVWEAGPGDYYLLFRIKSDLGDVSELTYKSKSLPAGSAQNVICFSVMEDVVGPQMREPEDLSKYKQAHSDYFDIEFWRNFVKGVPSPTMQILIPAEEGKPIVFTATFGDNIGGDVGPSFVSQLQAPRMKEAEDDRSTYYFAPRFHRGAR
jgi:hypothetical protein